MASSTLTGLTTSEVAERIRAGLANRTPRSELRDFAQILARNLFTWFNAMVVPAAIALFCLAEIQGGIAVSGMAIVNTAIALIQEFRAKIHLDKLAILVESKARALRDGQVQTISAGDVVQGDTILLQTGDTIVADGPVLESRFLEIDEALLTGESDPVRRQPGDPLLSGSFCVAGEGSFRADKVGRAAFANNTSAQARRYHFVPSPMTRIINLLVQILSYTAVGLIVLYTIAYVIQGFPKTHAQEVDFARMIAATITSLVPQGMVLTATVSFTVGAVYMSRRGAVVQRLNAVEAMASIDVICTDKTGTLTTNQLRLERLQMVESELPEDVIRRRLQLFASASVDRQNKNIQALCRELGQVDVEALDQIPFKSQNRYSAVRIRDEGTERILIFGAFEALKIRIGLWHGVKPGLATLIEGFQRTGQRVLVFGEMDAGIRPPLHPYSGGEGWDEGGVSASVQELHASPRHSDVPPSPQPSPPSTGEREQMPAFTPGANAPGSLLPVAAIRPLALVCFGDELRPEAGKVLEALYAQGIQFKIISGDNPETVRATVSQLNLPLSRDPVVSGEDLAGAANADELIRTHSVFGRVSPEQKVAIVESLKRQGFRVAMIGDGVNDVLPIKRADLGIAMGDGSQASKTVAGLILEKNDFALLPEILEEGRTIVRNLRRSSKLFLVKNVYSLILILVYAVGIGSLHFPYIPQQVTLLNWLVIGIPAFVIAVNRERSTTVGKPHFLREVGGFALRTGILFSVAGIAAMLISAHSQPHDGKHQRTMLLTTLILLGITALFRALKDGEPSKTAGDLRFRLLAMLAIPGYVLAMYWPMAASFFELVPLEMKEWMIVFSLVAGTYLLTLATDTFLIFHSHHPTSTGADSML